MFHPASGQGRVKGVTNAPNIVLHPWLETEVTAILATLPEPPVQTEAERRAAWEGWQEGPAVQSIADLPSSINGVVHAK